MQVFDIVSSKEPIIDRKSVFVAHMVRIDDKSQISQVMVQLLQSSKIRKATHNIMAYRISSSDSGYDDDGEGGAGIRLLNLLDNCNYEKVMVVVTRWYGGIHLGSDRFKRISDAAKELLKLHYKWIEYYLNVDSLKHHHKAFT